MKFMQRAAATASPATSNSPDEHSAKRRKLDSSRSSKTYDSPDQAAIKRAIQEREQKRRAAFEKHATDSADTQWVLDSTMSKLKSVVPSAPRNIVYVGYGDIDATDGSDDEPDQLQNGRKRIGNYKSSDDPVCLESVTSPNATRSRSSILT
jgi:hypothetical protein